MADTKLTRTGAFDGTKLFVLDGQLAVAGMPRPFAVYKSATGLLVDWPNGLTAGQITTAQGIINAYVEPTDFSFLTPLQQTAFNFLAIASPTEAQQNAALKGIIKYLLSISYGQGPAKTTIDGTSLTT